MCGGGAGRARQAHPRWRSQRCKANSLILFPFIRLLASGEPSNSARGNAYAAAFIKLFELSILDMPLSDSPTPENELRRLIVTHRADKIRALASPPVAGLVSSRQEASYLIRDRLNSTTPSSLGLVPPSKRRHSCMQLRTGWHMFLLELGHHLELGARHPLCI